MEKTDNWKNSCEGNKITAIGLAYSGVWWHLGENIGDHELEVIIADIQEEEKEVGYIRSQYKDVLKLKSYRSIISVYRIYDQHKNMIYELPAEACMTAYSPLMGSYPKK